MRVLWLVALAGLLFYLLQTIYLHILGLSYPFQLDYGESLVLYQAQRIAGGLSIYKDINSYPYIFSNYPPLLQAVVSPLIALVGPAFWPGRMLAGAAAAGLGLVAVAMVQRGGSRLAALTAALLFLGAPYIYHWVPLFRIDLPALLLATLGMVVLMGVTPEKTIDGGGRSSRDVHRRRNTQRIYLAGLLFCLGLFTKHSYLAAPAIALLYLAVANRRLAGHLLASYVLFGLLPFITLQIATGGAFAYDLIVANVNPFSIRLLLDQTSRFIVGFWPVFVLAAAGAVSTWRGTPGVAASPGGRLLFWYLVASLLTILLAGKSGAWENYFFEPLFMLCVFAGLGLSRLLSSPSLMGQLAAPMLLIVQLVLMWRDPLLPSQIVREQGLANRALAPLIAAQSDMILAEDTGLLLVNGQDIPFFAFQYTQLAREGKWDQAWVVDNLLNGSFSLVVLDEGTREDPDHYQRFTRQMLSALDTAYGLVARVGKYRVYAPQPPAATSTAVFGGQIALRGYRLDAASPPAGGDITIPDAAATVPDLNCAPGGSTSVPALAGACCHPAGLQGLCPPDRRRRQDRGARRLDALRQPLSHQPLAAGRGGARCSPPRLAYQPARRALHAQRGHL